MSAVRKLPRRVVPIAATNMAARIWSMLDDGEAERPGGQAAMAQLVDDLRRVVAPPPANVPASPVVIVIGITPSDVARTRSVAGASGAMPRIMEAVARAFRVTEEEIHADIRSARVMAPRAVCAWLARRLTNLTYREISEYLKRRDHSTILHAVRHAQKLVDKGGEVADRIRCLETALRNEATPC